jgi:hypothetical protein
MKYTVETQFCDEGGSVEFYCIKEDKNLGFKQFKSKKAALSAYKKQKLLSKYKLAPKVIGQVCKLLFSSKTNEETNWGYITEMAVLLENAVLNKNKRYILIQELVDNIYAKTRLKFWDCHYFNVGIIVRNNKKIPVCIDTGKESFDPNCNAWGFGDFPGPKCRKCDTFQCICSTGCYGVY